MSIGKRIKELRKGLGLSVDDIADKLGKNRATIYRYESDEIENLPITVIEPLAEILNTTPAYLMGWDDLEKTLSKSEQETKFINALKLIDCDIEYNSWLIPPKDFELPEKEYYTITYGDVSFNISISEYNELIKDIKSYLRFKILNLNEKRKEETPDHLLLNAAHEIEGASEEDKAHDDAIMDDDDF
ncbi:hypothetical protein CIW83_09260 [Tissierella sp. P1]|uniref:helix-turn-helix domain-containing protein n=1 Tax=Tissierella sp. P1 TaxID=1280483 RepID=UPI000BA0C456|nr:helix-turn-helix transcriptional regulator [Tissierella sp. P1]OZV12277.1 hypothetical protein CIW83_09260 [Tissierella sp. P1]